MNITLIGMPGAGKSTVGVVLAKRMGMDFIDTDLIIQKEYNKTLSEIINEKGIEGFKKVENDVISKLELDNTIIATGGSAVYGKEAMKHLRDISKVVYIELTEENIEDRLGDLNERGVVLEDGETLQELYDTVQDKGSAPQQDCYFFVFGYQRADVLKSETKLSQSDDIDMMFNLGNAQSRAAASPKDMFRCITEKGAPRGIHVLMWQDSYQVLEQDDKDIMSYFNMKTAFSMTPEEFSRAVGENDVSLMGENNAVYYNRARDNQKFRPYQMPDESWAEKLCGRLNETGSAQQEV